MRFGILGPLEVADERGRELELGGRRQRSVLAILLLHANEVVSRDRLIEELWSGRPPASAATSLHAHISRLRRALGDDQRIVTVLGGYLIRVADGELDRDRFEHLVEEGGAAISAGDWELASGTLREALSLWRGAALSDFEYESFAQAEVARLQELRVGSIEQRIEAELALGRETQTVGDLERLVREHPYRERLHGQLMLALYRTGRQTDALATYQAARRTLVEELGIEPSIELRELEQRILRHDSSLSTPGAEAPPPAAGHLPVPATPFLGRVRELAEVIELLRGADRRLVTLTGAGGSGKTRLALRAAQACAEAYPGGAWFVRFADVTDPRLIAPGICQAIGVAEQPELTPAQRLEECLRDRQLLLVLDNLEQLTPGTGVLGQLLAGCPGVRMLATSREPLHLAGEQQYEVPVLDLGDAIELFTARAKAVAPSVIIERETVGAVCEQLDRLPLAIELAAARTKVLSPAQILARLEGHLPVLATGPRDAPRRQRTLTATIDWSYELLTDEEQRLFARLSVFAGGFTLDSAEAVCDARLDTLGALVDRSLLRSGGGRYWMLQTLREYALDKLARSGEEDDLRRRHAQWFVEVLASHGLDKTTDVDTGRLRMLLEEERENFRAALEWGDQAGKLETVARLAASLTRLWTEEGRLSEADRWLRVARARSAEYPLTLQAQLLAAACELAAVQGARQEWADLCEQALAVYRELRDAGGIIRSMDLRAQAAYELGDLPGARVMMERALELAREHEDTGWLPTVLSNLAGIAITEGKLGQARAFCEEALSSGTGASLATDLVVCLQLNLAQVANRERRYANAAKLGQDALNGGLAIRFLQFAAGAALCLAWSLAELQQPERAAWLLGAAAEYYRHTGTAMQLEDRVAEHAARETLDRQLDERTFNELLDAGRAMTIEQAALIAGRLTTTPDRLPRDARRLRSV
jgi:predicted ATPase/DNA-binding SARP family transcriptional activator